MFRTILLVGLAIVATACGSSSTAPTATTSPTAPAAAASTSLSLAGAWSGTMGSSTTSSLKVTWTASQNGANVSGPLVIQADFGDNGKPNIQNINGTMSGVISGTQVAFTLSIPVGAFAAIGSPACSISGSGSSSSATASALTGTLTLTFADPCVGTVTDPGKSSETDQLSLTKS